MRLCWIGEKLLCNARASYRSSALLEELKNAESFVVTLLEASVLKTPLLQFVASYFFIQRKQTSTQWKISLLDGKGKKITIHPTESSFFDIDIKLFPFFTTTTINLWNGAWIFLSWQTRFLTGFIRNRVRVTMFCKYTFYLKHAAVWNHIYTRYCCMKVCLQWLIEKLWSKDSKYRHFITITET